MIRLLIVEDNVKLSGNIVEYLSQEFEIIQAFNGEDAIDYLDSEECDLVVLDLMLPKVNGMTVLKHITKKTLNTGVIILTAKEELDDKLKAFKIGANDYLTKPFFMEELKARIYIILRSMGKVTNQNMISFNDLFIDTKKKKCFIISDGTEEDVELPEKLYRLLEYFLVNKGVMLFKEQIFDRICGFESDAATSIIEVYISQLRKKLMLYGYDKYLITKRGMGYIWELK